MARVILDTLKIVGLFALLLVAFGVMLPAATAAGLPAPIAVIVVLCQIAFTVWATYAYLRYREGRQEEVRELLTAAVSARMPLSDAVYAYLQDRPSRGRHWYRLGMVFCVLLPVLFPLCWWLRRRAFDRRLLQFAEWLESGFTVSEALRAVPAVASRETRLAVAVGEATGDLPGALKRSAGPRLGAAWLEFAPQILYPFLLLLLVTGITTHLTDTVWQRYRRIFEEFGQPLPTISRDVVFAWWHGEDTFIIPGFFLTVIVGAALLTASPTVRWYAPVIGRLYRVDTRGLVLRTLGLLLGAGRTVPQALAFLAHAPELPEVVRNRLRTARDATMRGEPLADALQAGGLLPDAMAPLVGSSERARTLPWALGELGEHLRCRALRLMRRMTQVVTPVVVIALGALVGLIAVAFFIPLIQLITGFAQ